MDLENLTETVNQLKSFEKEIADLFQKGEIKSPVHFSSGNEEQLIKIFRGLRDDDYITHSQIKDYTRSDLISSRFIEIPDNLPKTHMIFSGVDKDDWIFSSYRSHYQALLKGIPSETLKKAIVEGRSMFFSNSDYKLISSAIVPGHLPIALGIAMGLKRKNSEYQVWAFCGDMAAETGVFHEVTKYADNHELPITFVIEDNGLSVDTPTEAVWKKYNDHLKDNTIRYKYLSGVPHQGLGKEAGF